MKRQRREQRERCVFYHPKLPWPLIMERPKRRDGTVTGSDINNMFYVGHKGGVFLSVDHEVAALEEIVSQVIEDPEVTEIDPCPPPSP